MSCISVSVNIRLILAAFMSQRSVPLTLMSVTILFLKLFLKNMTFSFLFRPEIKDDVPNWFIWQPDSGLRTIGSQPLSYCMWIVRKDLTQRRHDLYLKKEKGYTFLIILISWKKKCISNSLSIYRHFQETPFEFQVTPRLERVMSNAKHHRN